MKRKSNVMWSGGSHITAERNTLFLKTSPGVKYRRHVAYVVWRWKMNYCRNAPTLENKRPCLAALWSILFFNYSSVDELSSVSVSCHTTNVPQEMKIWWKLRALRVMERLHHPRMRERMRCSEASQKKKKKQLTKLKIRWWAESRFCYKDADKSNRLNVELSLLSGMSCVV